jgi:hypothetical protein
MKAHTTRDIAEKLVDLCNQNRSEECLAFYHPDAISREAMEGPMNEIKGLEAIKGKSQWWYENHTVNGFLAKGPYVRGEHFAVHFFMDVTEKKSGKREKMEEVGLYTVKDGKIVSEEFMY